MKRKNGFVPLDRKKLASSVVKGGVGVIQKTLAIQNRRTNITFDGLLDDNGTLNPDFCNWHKVFVHYCDGSSFQSNVEEVDPKNNLTFRGGRIFNALMDELIAKGMGNGQNVWLINYNE
ncbi:hypothetical protein ACS0TY_022500 [Phlomoides rotata]